MLSATSSLRHRRAIMLTALLAAVVAGLSATSHADGRRPQPNIVVIVTDDQAASMMDQRALPNTFAQLVAKGTTFTDSIVAA